MAIPSRAPFSRWISAELSGGLSAADQAFIDASGSSPDGRALRRVFLGMSREQGRSRKPSVWLTLPGLFHKINAIQFFVRSSFEYVHNAKLMQPSKIPNLFLVGSGKCGTTTLYDYLNQHPDVFMCSPKEPAYFCQDIHKESDEFHKKQKFFFFRSEPEYMNLFTPAKSQKVRGEASTLYFISKVSAKNIHGFNPQAKIVISIRNPVDLLYSIHGEYVLRFRENIQDFYEALAAEKTRRNGENIPEMAPAPSILFYSEYVKYSSHIQRYLDWFDKEQVKVIIYEEFKENNDKVIQDLFKFIHVDPDINIESKNYRSSRKIKSKLLKSALASPYVSQLPKKIIKGKRYYKWRSSFYKFAAKDEPRPQLQPKFIKELMEKYKEEVKKTERLLNRDLSKIWGY